MTDAAKNFRTGGCVLWAVVFAWLLWPGWVCAQSGGIRATLSKEEVRVGEPFQLQISVEGASDIGLPDNFFPEGLAVLGRSQNLQTSIVNFRVSTAVNVVFTLVAEREGEFEIPALTVRSGGRTLQTAALRVRASGSAPGGAPGFGPGAAPGAGGQPVPGSGGSAGAGSQGGGGAGVPARLELVVPVTEAWVGQAIPVEIRAVFDDRFQFELRQPPELQAEGVIVSRLSEPQRREQMIGGVPHVVLVFQALLTPVKAGPLEIPSARLECQMVVPGGRGPTAMEDLLRDFFGMDPFGGFVAQRRDLELKSDAVRLEVRDLPRQGRPAGFSGAIGQFGLRQSVTPVEGKPGEPMTVKIEVSGQGNFGAIPVPRLENTDGWRVYTGAENFRANDAIGFSGTKEFEVTVMPLREASEAPRAVFSYFDPVKRDYVTLRAPVQAVAVRGQAVTPTPSPQQSGGSGVGGAVASPAAAASPSSVDEERDAGKDEGEGGEPFVEFRRGSFVPVFLRPGFLGANAVMAVLVVGWVLVMMARRAAGSRGAVIARQRKELAGLLRQLESPGLEMREFFRVAAECVRAAGALAGVNVMDGASVKELAGVLGLGVDSVKGLERVWQIWEEHQFSSRPRSPSLQEREEALEVLRAVVKAAMRFSPRMGLGEGGRTGTESHREGRV